MENTELRFHVGAHPEHPRDSVTVSNWVTEKELILATNEF
jgi:hypothetical protein